MIKIDAGYSSGSRILYRDATQLLRMRLARAGPELIWMTPSSEVTLTPHRRRHAYLATSSRHLGRGLGSHLDRGGLRFDVPLGQRPGHQPADPGPRTGHGPG